MHELSRDLVYPYQIGTGSRKKCTLESGIGLSPTSTPPQNVKVSMLYYCCNAWWRHDSFCIIGPLWGEPFVREIDRSPVYFLHKGPAYYNDVIMTMMASQITSLTVVCSIVSSDADQRKHHSSASRAFVRGIHQWPVNSPHNGPVTRKMFPFDDVIMSVVLWYFLWYLPEQAVEQTVASFRGLEMTQGFCDCNVLR